MGLKEKQAIHSILENDIPRYQKRITENGLNITLSVDWDHVPQTGTDAIDRCKMLLGEFSTRFWDFGQDKVAKTEIEKTIKSVKILHDGNQSGEYDYKLKLNGSCLEFSANLEKFTLTQNSKQKGLKESIGELL